MLPNAKVDCEAGVERLVPIEFEIHSFYTYLIVLDDIVVSRTLEAGTRPKNSQSHRSSVSRTSREYKASRTLLKMLNLAKGSTFTLLFGGLGDTLRSGISNIMIYVGLKGSRLPGNY